jgi:Trk K+ transport system NAD-binding subunit
MSSRVLICGLGKVGFAILEQLHRLGVPSVVITREISPELRSRTEEMAVEILLEDARSEQVLRQAGAAEARAVLVVTNDDLANLEIALDVRRTAPNTPIVLRLEDASLAEKVKEDLQLRAVLDPALLSAPRFVAAALGEETVATLHIAGQLVRIAAVMGTGAVHALLPTGTQPVAVLRANGTCEAFPPRDTRVEEGDRLAVLITEQTEDSPLQKEVSLHKTSWHHGGINRMEIARRSWSDLPRGVRTAVKFAVTLAAASVGVFHYTMHLSWLDALYFTVTILSTIGFGDINLLSAPPPVKLFGMLLMLTGSFFTILVVSIIVDFLMRARLEKMLGRPRTTLQDHVLVVGLGTVGANIVRMLRASGVPVLAVERDRDRPGIGDLRDAVPIVFDDAESEETLRQVNAGGVRCLVAATNDDMLNLRLAHAVTRENPNARIVVRVFHTALASKLGNELLGIHAALNAAHAAAARYVAEALCPDVEDAFSLGGEVFAVRRTAECGSIGPHIVLSDEPGRDPLVLMRLCASQRDIAEPTAI